MTNKLEMEVTQSRWLPWRIPDFTWEQSNELMNRTAQTISQQGANPTTKVHRLNAQDQRFSDIEVDDVRFHGKIDYLPPNPSLRKPARISVMVEWNDRLPKERGDYYASMVNGLQLLGYKTP